MKTELILATHGNFAKGILDSLQMIAGIQEDITTICAYTEKNVDYSRVFEEELKKHDDRQSRLLIITDLLGGSVNNEFMKLQELYPFTLIAGLNLSLLLELALSRFELTDDKIKEIVERNKEYIVICHDHMLSCADDSDF